MLPSPLYVRSAIGAGGIGGGEAALLPAGFAGGGRPAAGSDRAALRASPLQMSPTLPALTVLNRPLGDESQRRTCPGGREVARAPTAPACTSRAVVDLYGLRPGMEWPALSKALAPKR